MIISGYPGIGKSTLCENNKNVVDLESSCFWKKMGNEKSRPDDWYIYYCQMAKHLSDHGYIVFVSSHKEVRDYLSKEMNKEFGMIYPSTHLKRQWIQRLCQRYSQTMSEKDFSALVHAKESFVSDIRELDRVCKQAGYCHFRVVLDTIEYNLENIVASIAEQGGIQVPWKNSQL